MLRAAWRMAAQTGGQFSSKRSFSWPLLPYANDPVLRCQIARLKDLSERGADGPGDTSMGVKPVIKRLLAKARKDEATGAPRAAGRC